MSRRDWIILTVWGGAAATALAGLSFAFGVWAIPAALAAYYIVGGVVQGDELV